MKISKMLGQGEGTNHARRLLYSALWQADGKKIRRFVPIDFIGRYMDGFWLQRGSATGQEPHPCCLAAS